MQSIRPHPGSGRHYYCRPTNKQGGAPLSLTEETIRQHLQGAITIGLYAINPCTQRCKWVAIDADYKNAMEDLLKLEYYLRQDKVEPALEMSKRGGHLWILLEGPLLAKDCRIYIHDLASRRQAAVAPLRHGRGLCRSAAALALTFLSVPLARNAIHCNKLQNPSRCATPEVVTKSNLINLQDSDSDQI